ncbi:MAG: sensor histidine kinase, partial [Planctomycetota bacterium]
EVYRAHKGDEVVQLADSFRHMTHDLKASRAEMERSDRFQRSLIRNSYIGIFATDETDTVRIFNRVTQNLTGYSESEVVGVMTWEKLFERASTPRWEGQSLGDGSEALFGFYRRELALNRKGGGTVAVRATGASLLEEGRPIGKVFFVMDLREVQNLRDDLIRSERLAATGQTVASISHSIKNILDGLRGGAYIYRRGVRVEDPAVTTKGWATVERNIDLISELVADLLNFARDREPDLESCDPNELVTDVIENLSGKARQLDVSISTDLDPEAAPSRLDVHTMHQCLTNLVTNAIDAASGGGRVDVKTSVEGDTLELVVSDDGPGVAPEVAEEIFSGMVSTKGSKGTGLGLLVVSKVVTEHGGTIQLDRENGPGAVFRIRLPRRGGSETEDSAAAVELPATES